MEKKRDANLATPEKNVIPDDFKLFLGIVLLYAFYGVRFIGGLFGRGTRGKRDNLMEIGEGVKVYLWIHHLTFISNIVYFTHWRQIV